MEYLEGNSAKVPDIHRLGTVIICPKFISNTSNNYGFNKNNTNQHHGGAGGKIYGSPESVGSILWGP